MVSKIPQVLQRSSFPDNIFAEGIAMHQGKIYGLSWKEDVAFRINPDTFQVEQEFRLPKGMKEG